VEEGARLGKRQRRAKEEKLGGDSNVSERVPFSSGGDCEARGTPKIRVLYASRARFSGQTG